jgi:hypothetical protein
MKTTIFFLFVFSFLIITGCGGSALPGSKNIRGSVLYQDNGDSVESGIAILDNGTNSYRAEISGGSFEIFIPTGTYKVWFEKIEPFPVQTQYLSLEKTPVEVEVFGGKQNMSLQVRIDHKAKK